MGTVAFTLLLAHARWSYSALDTVRNVHVEVELPALERLAGKIAHETPPSAVLAANRAEVERAAREIIDREGPNFAEPVRVTAADV